MELLEEKSIREKIINLCIEKENILMETSNDFVVKSENEKYLLDKKEKLDNAVMMWQMTNVIKDLRFAIMRAFDEEEKENDI